MANSIAISGSATGSLNGIQTPPMSFSSQVAFTENNAPVLYQTVTTVPTLLALGGVSAVLSIVLQVLSGTGTQHVYLGLDNTSPPNYQLGDIPENLGTVLVKPCKNQPAQIYISVNTGTLLVKYQVIAQ